MQSTNAMKKNIIALNKSNIEEDQASTGEGRALGSRSRLLTVEEKNYTDVLYSYYKSHLVSTRGNCENTLKLAMGAITGFYKYVGLPPWEWTELDLSEFIHYKVLTKKIGIGRQCTYFTYLRIFQNFILDQRGLCNEIHKNFGKQFQRFVSNENAIPIKSKNFKRKKKIHVLTPEQCQKIVEQFDFEIKQAQLSGSKSFKVLKRNKSITILALLTGVRVEEIVDIKVSDFSKDIRHLNFGNYALLSVIGKGQKYRVVRLYNPLIKPVMDWYLDEVRPSFLKENSDPNLMFFSERGSKIGTEQIRRMVDKIGLDAGITTKVHPHLLRHTYATQMKDIIGPEALQQQLGHVHLSTTLGTYYHADPEHVGNQINIGINKMINAIDSLTQGIDDEDDF